MTLPDIGYLETNQISSAALSFSYHLVLEQVPKKIIGQILNTLEAG